MRHVICGLIFFSALWLSAAQAAPSIEEKMGQMLMFGFQGQQVNADSPFVRDLQRYHIGGVILFGRNITQPGQTSRIDDKLRLRQLVTRLKQSSRLPLLVAIDQEGGRIERLNPSNGFAHTLSAQELGQLDEVERTRSNATTIAKELRWVGINVDFAPVVDLNINPHSPVIGGLGRSFSADPAVVARHARVFAKVFTQHQIACASKHFPGHGSAQTDSHQGFTDVTETWSATELAPYQPSVGQVCPMVMVGHVFNRHLDAAAPASLSAPTITGVLRGQLHFAGVVITDDLLMGAVSKQYSLRETIKRAVNAGNDILLFGDNSVQHYPQLPSTVVALMRDLLRKGEISPARIDMAYQRVMALKQSLGLVK